MRKSLQPFTLRAASTPILVPANTMLCIPTAAMSRDPDYFPDPDTFNPWRFLHDPDPDPKPEAGAAPESETGRKFEAEEAAAGNDGAGTRSDRDFSSLDPHLPIWGLGRWSCPGRFYAEMQIKLVVVEMLEWDLFWPERPDDGAASAEGGGCTGQATGEAGSVERMKRINTGDRFVPDPAQLLVFAPRGERRGGVEDEEGNSKESDGLTGSLFDEAK